MSDDANSSPYELVESLYGPGAVGAWVPTILSILISWTVSKRHGCKDTLSIDLVTMLLFPIVAAGHLIYQITRLNDPITLTLTSPAPTAKPPISPF
jgi:phosphotransferase system  glucose/maltose/N-acetylglucosamine-specific IIC component